MLNGNWHTGFEACICVCVKFHTSIYVKIWRAGLNCFSVTCEGKISKNTNREGFCLMTRFWAIIIRKATEKGWTGYLKKHSSKQTLFN